MSNTFGTILAMTAGAGLAYLFLEHVIDVRQGEHFELQAASPQQPKPINGLAIYAEKMGLAHYRGADRPDDVIMAALLENDVEARNITHEKREISTASGKQSVISYTVDFLLQERLYERQDDVDLIYSVECSLGEAGLDSHITHRNLGEDVSLARVSGATYERGVHPAVTDMFCEELFENPVISEITKKPVVYLDQKVDLDN